MHLANTMATKLRALVVVCLAITFSAFSHALEPTYLTLASFQPNGHRVPQLNSAMQLCKSSSSFFPLKVVELSGIIYFCFVAEQLMQYVCDSAC